MKSLNLQCTVSDGQVSQAPIQGMAVTVATEVVKALISAAQVPLGASIGRKQKKDKPAPYQLVLSIKTPQGKDGEIVLGDTHVLWVDHQTGLGKSLLTWIFENRGGSLEVTGVRKTQEFTKGAGRKSAPQTQVATMKDCPF